MVMGLRLTNLTVYIPGLVIGIGVSYQMITLLIAPEVRVITLFD